MRILVNAQPTDVPDDCTVAQLLEQLGITTAGTAVACNAVVVRKALYADTTLSPDDHIEIIRAVAGG